MMRTHKTVIEEDLLSIREVIDILNIPRHTVDQWIEKGSLVPVRRTGALRFRPEDVRALFEGEEEGNGGSGRRILVIDDDPLVGKSLKNLLENNGYETQVASIGLAALDLASRERFDLVVTDIRMPGMNGIETLKALRRIRSLSSKPPLPEIVITAFDEGAVKEEVQRLGIRDFILKPFEIEEFLTALERNLKPGKNKTAHAF